jgi:hypothetical protein
MVEFHHAEGGARRFLGVPWRNNGALIWVGVLVSLAMAALTILYAYGALAS